MSRKPSTEQPLPPSPLVLPAAFSSHGGPSAEEDSTGAITLMMLYRGVREESLRLIGEATLPNPPFPDGSAAVSADAVEPAFLPSQEPQQVFVPSQTSAPVVAVVPAQAPALEPEVMQCQDPVLATMTSQVAPAPTVVSSQASAAAVLHKAPRKRAACKKTVAAARSEAPGVEKAASQLLHECQVCGKGFKTARGLSVHMSCHPDGRLHPCEFCGSTFPCTAALVSHLKSSDVCGGSRPRKLSHIAAAAIAFHRRVDLNLPEV